jgi:hypothetical protein
MKNFEIESGKNAIWQENITKNFVKWVKNKIEKVSNDFQKNKLIISYLYFLEEKFKEFIRTNLNKITD